MKKIIFGIFVLFISLSGYRSYAQVSRIPYYDHINFGESFFVIAETDQNNDFYVVDLTKLSSEFARTWFIATAFNENKLVRIDAGNSSMAWFKVDKSYPKADISQLLGSLKAQAASSDAAMTATEKNEWLHRNGK